MFCYLCFQVFPNLTLGNELFAKALQCLDTSLSVDNNFCGKLVSLLKSKITFYERFEATSAPFFISDFNFIFKLQIRQFYI